MKKVFILIIALLFSFFRPSQTYAADCIAPAGPTFDECPAADHSYYCYLDPAGMNQLTCCKDQQECINAGGAAPAVPQTIPVYDPGCASGGPYGINYGGVKTALGCLPTDPQAFINIATPWAVGIGAGIAFLLGVFGAIMIVLSAGNPEKMQAGKEMITSAIGGMILIIFSVFLLRVIGVDILKLF